MKSKHVFLLLAFIEGASVMACELMSAKLIAPFFGSSLYVWASVMGVTLFALMIGYYSGGYLSEKIKRTDLVFWILLFAGAFLAIMPNTSIWIMTNTLNMSVKVGSTLSLLVYMFPPLVLMGMSSPIIINAINTTLDKTGKSAGKVYAISTLGGILATYLVGFYLLPEFGIKWPTLIFGLVLMSLPLFFLLKGRKYFSLLVLVPLALTASGFSSTKTTNNKGVQMLHESEGLLGQIRVYDALIHSEKKGEQMARLLMVNNTAQSILERDDLEYSLWDWSILFPAVVSIYPENSDLLLMGLGGGMLYHQFKRQDFNIDVVELDERIKDIAIEYFAVDKETNIIVDDARRVINTSKKMYDVIMLDLFHNETPPEQVSTIESFGKMKNMLNPEGMIVMNFYGYTSGEKGKAARSVIKTFEKAGFNVNTFATPEDETYRNLIICASLGQPDWSKAFYTEKGLDTISGENIKEFMLDHITFDMKNSEVLTDQKPQLEKMYADAASEWRKHQMNFIYSRVALSNLELVK